MTKKEPTQKTPTQKTPKGHEIPVPTRKQVFRDLEKAAKRRPSQAGRRRPEQ
jgi:hypothetical protein